jgi:hypothetical protein
MLLNEMFSAIGAPKEDQSEIDWLDDLKFFIDNDDRMLENFIFPAVMKHEKNPGHPDVYKLYLAPLKRCLEYYCERFDIDDPKEKFSKDAIVDLAKKIAEEQEKHIKDGDYENK